MITALATPFYEGKVDVKSFERLLDQQRAGGITDFVIGGTTGEGATLTAFELAKLFRVARRCSPGARLIVATGDSSTARTITATERAEQWGADAVLVVVPAYNRPPARGLFAHFAAVAQATPLDVYLYDVPARTAARLEPETIVELAKNFKNIRGLKAAGDPSLITRLRAELPGFELLSGDDASAIKARSLGADGVISVLSHILPRDFINAIEIGDSSFIDHHRKLLEVLFVEINPIPVKFALHHLGIFRSPELRLPLVALAEHYQREVVRCL